MEKHFTDSIFMVRPKQFGSNLQTSGTNAFQSKITFDTAEVIRNKALQEFDEMVELLRKAGIKVQVFEDTDSPEKPDAVFPNNWISTHPDGTAVLYPMLAPNRREEFRQDIVDWLNPKEVVDYRENTNSFTFLEGTGSVILDQEAKIMYVGISPRTDVELAKVLAQKLGFTICSFHPTDHHKTPIYHTNVIMFVMKDLVAVCFDAIKNHDEREELIRVIHASGKEIIELNYYQISQFSGNMIQLMNQNGEYVLVASQSAWSALDEDQKQLINSKTKVVTPNISTIEMYGGGSARCMIAENFIQNEL